VSRLGYDNETYVRAPQLLKCVSFSRSAISRGKSAALHNVCIFVWFGATRNLPPRSSFPHTQMQSRLLSVLPRKRNFLLKLWIRDGRDVFLRKLLDARSTQSAVWVAGSRVHLTNIQVRRGNVRLGWEKSSVLTDWEGWWSQ